MAREGVIVQPSAAVLGFALVWLAPAVLAQGSSSTANPRIFQCIRADGSKITSDKPITDCSSQGRPQRELNKDGSEKAIVEAPPTEVEKADRERVQREQDAARKELDIAVRSDRDLIKRFPNEQAHGKARENALEVVRTSVRSSEARIKALQQERKPLTDEAEFYAPTAAPAKGAKVTEVLAPLPNRVRLALDANDAALEAQKSLVQNQEVEIARINARYDAELARLRKLWAGAHPGSLGPMPRATDATASK